MVQTQVQSLQDKINAHSDVWDMLYNAPAGQFSFPIKAEFSNWIDEQSAWQKSVILQNMSHHMTDVYFEGPDIIRLLSDLGVNTFADFGPMQAKQYVVCNYDGQYIGDSILICEEAGRVCITGKPMVANWVRFHIETGSYKVKVAHIDLPSPNLSDRRLLRFQVQGPNADKLLSDLNGGPLPYIPFFQMGRFNIGPHTVTALNHRMSGTPGYEFWGPSEAGQQVMELTLKAGESYDLTLIAGRIYPVTAAVSGWAGSVLPAIYTGEAMRTYRQWLPATSFEAIHSIGGSLANGKVGDHYRTPYDLGYGFMIKFDHDFIGRTALEALSLDQKLKKVRLIWSNEDVIDIIASSFRQGDRYKRLEIPMANYATSPSDRVQNDGMDVGVSYYPVFSEAERACISLAAIPAELAVDGRALTVIWGEPNGGSGKITVENHIQKTVRVTVDSNPIKRE